MQRPGSDQKECPFCKEQIQAAAIICRFCSFDTTAKYEPCKQCAELIKCSATSCRYCSYKKPGDHLGSAVPFTPKKPDGQPTRAALPMPGRDSGSSYGMGVRGQVFEVIVRQAMHGAPWREICAGPMKVNNISPDEVEAEVRRRNNLLS
jgi:hypothetical protein